MTAQSKTTLKAYFETGDYPTQAQFVDLIDTIPGDTGALLDADIPSTIARDTEVTSAIGAHVIAADPHGDRAFASGLAVNYDAAGAASTAVSNHTSAVDPHGDRAYAATLTDDLSGVTQTDTARKHLAAAPLQRRPTIALAGDSITAGNSAENRNVGPFHWANALLGARFNVVAYAGVGGNTSAQLLARLQTDVIAYDPDYCLVMIGTNDIGQGVAAATTIANLDAIYEMLYAAGIRVIACTVNPTTSANTIDKRRNWYTVDRWQKAEARSGRFILVDIAAAYIDSTSEWPWPASGMCHDGVHPTALGAQRMGTAIADALRDIVPGVPVLPTLNGDELMLSANPMMAGSNGFVTAPGTGTVADHWRCASGTASKVARTDGLPGVWQQLVPDAGAKLASLYEVPYPIDYQIAAGDSVYAICEIETDNDWVNPTTLEMNLVFLDAAGSTINLVRGALQTSPNSGTAIENPGACVLRSDTTIAPANTAKVRMFIKFMADSGTVRVSRAGIVNESKTLGTAVTASGTGAFVGLGYGVAGQVFGSTAVFNLFSLALCAALTPGEMTSLVRFKLGATQVGDATTRRVLSINRETESYLRIAKTTANTFTVVQRNVGYATQTITASGLVADTWHTISATCSVSATQLKAFLDGAQVGSTTTITGTYVKPPTPNAFVAGALDLAKTNPLDGSISDIILSTSGATIASAANVATIHAALAAGTLVSATLDGIFGTGKWAWWHFTA